MYGKVKLTKKQIKEDKFTSFMLTAKQEVTDNWQYYVIGFIIFILAIAAVVFFLDMQKAQKDEAAFVYSQGVAEYRQSQFQNSMLSFQKVLDDFSGTESAQLATYMLGKTNLRQRSYADAILYFEMYLSKYSNDNLKIAAAYAGIASAYEDQGKYAEAASKFVAACQVDENGPLVGDYHLSAMKNFLESGDVASAETHYKYIIDNFFGTELAKKTEILFSEKTYSKQ